MDTVHQEMQHEEHGVIRKVEIDVEEEPVHRILEEGKEKVSKDVQRGCFKNSGGRYRGNERQREKGILSEGRQRLLELHGSPAE